jgi:predicted GIY-YIG superfamily endonuclease
MSFFVYILKCNDNSYYVGHTDNIEQRLIEHAEGMSNYTSTRLPVKIVYQETFQTRDEAFVMERRIKGWNRKKKEALIQKNFDLLVELSNK